MTDYMKFRIGDEGEFGEIEEYYVPRHLGEKIASLLSELHNG